MRRVLILILIISLFLVGCSTDKIVEETTDLEVSDLEIKVDETTNESTSENPNSLESRIIVASLYTSLNIKELERNSVIDEAILNGSLKGLNWYGDLKSNKSLESYYDNNISLGIDVVKHLDLTNVENLGILDYSTGYSLIESYFKEDNFGSIVTLSGEVINVTELSPPFEDISTISPSSNFTNIENITEVTFVDNRGEKPILITYLHLSKLDIKIGDDINVTALYTGLMFTENDIVILMIGR